MNDFHILKVKYKKNLIMEYKFIHILSSVIKKQFCRDSDKTYFFTKTT